MVLMAIYGAPGEIMEARETVNGVCVARQRGDGRIHLSVTPEKLPKAKATKGEKEIATKDQFDRKKNAK